MNRDLKRLFAYIRIKFMTHAENYIVQDRYHNKKTLMTKDDSMKSSERNYYDIFKQNSTGQSHRANQSGRDDGGKMP